MGYRSQVRVFQLFGVLHKWTREITVLWGALLGASCLLSMKRLKAACTRILQVRRACERCGGSRSLPWRGQNNGNNRGLGH